MAYKDEYEVARLYSDKLFMNKYSSLVYKRLRYELYKFLSNEMKENKEIYYIIIIKRATISSPFFI